MSPVLAENHIAMARGKEPKQIRALKAVQFPTTIKAERCRRSYFHFMQEFWGEVSSDPPQWNWHIEYLAEQLSQIAQDVADKKVKKHDLIINIPPGTTKSISCSIMFPPWCWTKWPWMRFIVSSYSGALSLEHAEYSRDLIRSDKYKRLFPEIGIKQDKDTKSNFRIQRTVMKKVRGEDGKFHNVSKIEPGGNRYSTSVGGTLTGFHGHILLVDDPLDPNRAISPVELASANRWLDQTLSTRKVDKAITPTILIMQRLHQDDPTGHILAKNKKNVFHICLPGEIYSPKYRERVRPVDFVRKYKDGLLDPGRMSRSVLAEMEVDLGQYGYAGQVGQHPTPPGGGMFKVDHFQVVDSASAVVGKVENTVRYWDKAGTAEGGTYTVGVKMSKIVSSKGNKYLIHDVKRGQWASNEREDIIKETAEADGRGVYVWAEQEPGSGGKDSINATIQNLDGFVVKADLPVGNKVYRADPYSVQVNNGNVYLLRADWNGPFKDEHGFFPFSTYKDQVDASAGAYSKLIQKKKHFGTWGRR